MSEAISADDLALLAASFEAAMTDVTDPGEADQALYELGWPELLHAAPARGAAMAFHALGTTGSAAGLLDDVVAHALGLPISPTTCVGFPAVLHSNPAAPDEDDPTIWDEGDFIVANGVVSSRINRADTVMLIEEDLFGQAFSTVKAERLRVSVTAGVDPGHAYHHLSAKVGIHHLEPLEIQGSWEVASTAARVALAHQLIGGARWMLAEARQHAIDREQFGQPVASFQAIRHKLADSLVLIEGAASVANACLNDSDPVLAGLAKSLAGRAALTTASHAQQVLAGIGFTAEHRFHLWLKRMLVLDALFGSSSTLPTDIGRDLLIYGTVPRLIEL